MQLGDTDEMAEPFLVRVMKVVLPELLPGIDLVHAPADGSAPGAGRSVCRESDGRRGLPWNHRSYLRVAALAERPQGAFGGSR